jgi:acyl-homoserine lactone acylase PvdQ
VRTTVPTLLCSAAVLLAAAVAPASGAMRAYSILPPGQAGALPPTASSTDQLAMFDAMTPLAGGVTEADVPRYYKRETLGTPGMPGRRTHPTPGVTIVRDSYGVPHVFGATRKLVAFGAGWATAEDRSLFIEAIRGPGRLAALDAPGVDPLALATSLRAFTPSRATERTLAAEARALKRTKAGRGVLDDVDGFVAGVNAQRRSVRSTIRPWTANDVVASAGILAGQFASFGGQEDRNAAFVAALAKKLGSKDAALRVFHDLAQRNDPEAPVTIAKRTSYEPGVSGAQPAAVVPDAAGVPAPGASLRTNQHSSALLVDAAHSTTGRSLAVMGPQVGFYYPEFLEEMDLHGGGIDVRGVSFPGLGMYVLIGRGTDFAWSGTSAGTDNRDVFADELCSPGGGAATTRSTGYRYRGRCRPMGTFDAGRLAAGGGAPAREVRYRTTVHGPVRQIVTASGKPYALTIASTTRGRALRAGVTLHDLDTGKLSTPRRFVDEMSRFDFVQNWFYADARHIAFVVSGRLPLRAKGVDPDLPTLGTGRYEWRGYLAPKDHPHAIDPPSGRLLNWNNQQAPGFAGSDADFPRLAIQRVDLFEQLPAKASVTDLLSRMNEAGVQDFRAVRMWPAVGRILATGPAPSPLAQRAADLVTAWGARGGERLDRDGDGKLDDPGAMVLDRAWPGIADAVMAPVLGSLTEQLRTVSPRDRLPGDQSGSSWYGVGWEPYVEKDLRTLARGAVKAPFKTRFCGAGDLAACRTALWAAIDGAAQKLAAEQGADPAAWRADEATDRITFKPGVLGKTARWSNRPTFQQVVTFTR